ncbi:MAG: PDZ domain-containing protein, partial [Deltaproteobacteria bacterium]|nr:PDZ domain-containing protein [Deltaproteobacteria bacterium]
QADGAELRLDVADIGGEPGDSTGDARELTDAGGDARPDSTDLEDGLVPPDADAPDTVDGPDVEPGPWAGRWPAMHSIDGQLLVEGTYEGGGPILWVMDTGAARTYAHSDVTGTTNPKLASFSIGPLEFADKQLYSVDLSEAEAYIGWKLGGLAGQDMFNKRFIALDYADPGAWFLEAVPEVPPKGVLDAPPEILHYELPSSIPVVQATFVAGTSVTVPVVADTGSGVTILTQDVFDSIDDGSLPRLDGYVWATNYGSDASFVTRIPRIQAGENGQGNVEWSWAIVIPEDNHLFPLLKANGIDVKGFLGYPFYRNFVVGVDGAENRYLWWEYQDKGHLPVDEWTRVGIEPIWREEGFRIEMIYAPSDAQAQGILIGDVITTIDGKDVTGGTLDEVRQALRSEPGTALDLGLLRDGKPLELVVIAEDLLPVPTCLTAPLETAMGADGTALVRGFFDGKKTWFAVDSAAQVVFADLEFTQGQTAYVELDLDVGPFHFTDWLSKGRDLKVQEESLGFDIGALLGQEILLMAYVLRDPATPSVRICEGKPAEPPMDLGPPAAVHPFEMVNQFPVTEVDVGLAETIPLLLDTGQGITYITQEVLDQVAPNAPKVSGWVYETKYGSDPAVLTRIPTIGIGGIQALDQVVAVIPTEHHMAGTLELSGVFVSGFLGNSVLGRFAVGVDGPGSMLDLWPLDGTSGDGGLWERVGIEMVWDGLGYPVKFVLSPSDAETLGIVPGDLLLTVDDVDVAQMGSLAEVQKSLRGKDGEVRHLKLSGTSGEYEVDVLVEDLLPIPK